MYRTYSIKYTVIQVHMVNITKKLYCLKTVLVLLYCIYIYLDVTLKNSSRYLTKKRFCNSWAFISLFEFSTVYCANKKKIKN